MQNLSDSDSDYDKEFGENSKVTPVKANVELDAWWDLEIDWENIVKLRFNCTLLFNIMKFKETKQKSKWLKFGYNSCLTSFNFDESQKNIHICLK